jgi:hypothetical protein
VRAADRNVGLGNSLVQTRVHLPNHVLGHPCLYYPNFISQHVAAQVTLRANHFFFAHSVMTMPPLPVSPSHEAEEDFPHERR